MCVGANKSRSDKLQDEQGISSLLEPILTTESIPVILISTVLLLVFFVKLYNEVATVNHSIKGQKLSSLIECLNEGIQNKNRLSVELLFQDHFKYALSYNEIDFLLKSDSPILALYSYKWAQKNLKFDSSRKILVLNKKIKFSLRIPVLTWLFVITSILGLIGLLLLAASISTNASSEWVFNFLAITASFIYVAWLSIMESKTLYSTKRLLEMNAVQSSNYKEGN